MKNVLPQRRSAAPPGQSGRTNLWRPLLVLICLMAVCTGYTVFAGRSLHAATGQQEKGKPRPGVISGVKGDGNVSPEALKQIGVLLAEKESRTPAQQKIDSQLLYAAKAKHGDAMFDGMPEMRNALLASLGEKTTQTTNDVQFVGIQSRNGLVRVDIRTKDVAGVAGQVAKLGGEVEATYAHSDSVLAYVSLESLEDIASNPAVSFITPPSKAYTHRAEAPEMTEVPVVAGPPTAAEARADRLARFRQKVMATVADYNARQEPIAGGRNGGKVTTKGQVEEEAFTTRANDVPLPESNGKANKAKAQQTATAINREPIRYIGSRNSQGDRTHRSFDARNAFGVDGTGLKIGVISDSFNNLGAAAADVTNGDLPGPGNPNGFTTPVQFAGSGDLAGGGSDEGRAMMQIVHDVAPGAQLWFATAFNSIEDFGNSIAALGGLSTFRGAPVTGTIVPGGCDVIIDDIGYFVETPLHKGQTAAVTSPNNIAIVTEAVNAVNAAGKLYFSSAGNEGNVTQATAGCWEGDFASGGTLTIPGQSTPSEVLDWDNTAAVAQSNGLTATSIPVLHWSDPIGASTNDYDLFVLNSTLTTVVGSGTTIQNGTQDPLEFPQIQVASGNRIVVVRKAGAEARFLNFATQRGRLQFATNGEIRGHATAENGYGVAATPAAATFGAPTPNGPFPNPFISTNQIENFSSDGPRRVFFNADNSPVTPGNFLAGTSGGQVLQKPDITAADGVDTTLPAGSGLNPFYGTSAAAPHAGAIAALVKAGFIRAGNPNPSLAQVRTVLQNNALDIMAAGVDRDSGAGIVQAFQSVQATGATGVAFLALGTTTLTRSGGGQIVPGDSTTLTVQLSNVGVANATGITATVASSTPGITVSAANSGYVNLAPAASANNTTPFTVLIGAQTVCPLTINFTITVNYTGGATPSQVLPFSISTSQPITINETLDTTAPAANPAYTAITGTQTGRITRDGVAGTCANKAFPGLTATTGARRFDAYTFPAAAVPQCITYSVSDLTGTTAKIFTVAYNGAFNPASLSTNYASDTGSSLAGGAGAISAQVNVPAGVSLTIVIHEVNVGGAPNNNYRLVVDGFACAIPTASIIPPAGNVTVTEGAGADGDTFVEPCENGNLTVAVSNRGGAAATGVSGTVTTSTPGVTITGGTAAYADIAPGGTGTNSTPFTFTSTSLVPCNSTVNCTLTLTFSGGASGASPIAIPFSFTIGRRTNYSFASSTGATIPGNPANGVLVPLSQDDDAIAPIAAPFNFRVYDTQIAAGQTVSLSTNGNIQFVASGANSTFSNAALPATALPNAPALFPYWDDLDLRTTAFPGGGIYTQVVGTAPNRQWVVEWRGQHFDDTGTAQTLNFAVVFNEGTNRFNYVYALTGVVSPNGVSATIGAQAGNSGTNFTQFSFNTASSVTAGQQLAATRPVACDVCPTVNSSVNLFITSQSFPALVGCSGYTNQAVLTGTLVNTGSVTLSNIQYEVVELREANGTPPANPFRLRSAIGASCGTGGLVGSRQNGPVSLAAGASSTTETFTVDMSSMRRFRILLSVLGTESFGATNNVKDPVRTRLASAIVEVDALGKVVAVTPVNLDSPLVNPAAPAPKAAEKK